MSKNLSVKLALLVVLLLAGVSTALPAKAESLLERAQRDGYVRVGFPNEEPYAYVTSDGKLVGAVVDIVRVVLQKMGIKEVDGVLTQWGSLIPALKSNRIDIIGSGMFVTPKRCQEVIFSEPVFSIGEAFLVKAGNPKKLLTLADVAKDKSANLGMLQGAIENEYAKLAGIDPSQVHAYPDFPTELAALKSGRLDALVMDALTAERQVQKEGQDSGIERTPVIEKIGDKYLKGHGAFAFRKEDAAFAKEFDKYLVAFLGTQDHLDSVATYGFTKGELPEKTTAELCKG